MFAPLLSLFNSLTVRTTTSTEEQVYSKELTTPYYSNNDSNYVSCETYISQILVEHNLKDLIDDLSSFKKMNLKFDNFSFFNQLKISNAKDIDKHCSSIREMYDLVSRYTKEENPHISQPQESRYEDIFKKEKSDEFGIFTIDYIEKFLSSITLNDPELLHAKASANEMLQIFRSLLQNQTKSKEDATSGSILEPPGFPSFKSFIVFLNKSENPSTINEKNEDYFNEILAKIKLSWFLNLIVRLYELLRYKDINSFENYLVAYKNVLILEYMEIDEFKALSSSSSSLFYKYFYEGFFIMSKKDVGENKFFEIRCTLTFNEADCLYLEECYEDFYSGSSFFGRILSFFKSILRFIGRIFGSN